MYASRTSKARPPLNVTSTQVVVQENQPTSPPSVSPPRSATASPALPEGILLPFGVPVQAWWQAVLFVDGRSRGRLVAPEVAWEPLEADEQHGSTVGQLSLHFCSIVPTRAAAAAAAAAGCFTQQQEEQAQPLCLPVDECFAKRSYRVQVFGREQQGEGASVAVPHAFQAHGRELNAALNVQRQWQEYQQRHQAARTSAGQPVSDTNFAHSSTLPVQSGDGLEHLQAIFDVATRPAWLKGLVCRFLVAEPSEPSDATVPVDGSGSSGAGTAERGGAAVAGGSMAASAAVQAGSRDGTASASCLPAKPRQQPSQERRPPGQEEQHAPGEQQHAQAHAPAAQAAASDGSGAGAQQPSAGAKEGTAKRKRNAARKQRAAQALAAEQGRSSAEPSHAAPAQHPPGSKGSGAASSSASSTSASTSQPAAAAQPPSTAAGPSRRGKGPAGGRSGQQGAAEPVAGGASHPSAAGKGPGGRSRSRSGSRPSSRQDASVVHRHPNLFPAAVEQQQQQQQMAAGRSGLMPAASECGNAASGTAAPPRVPSSAALGREAERGHAAKKRTAPSTAACNGAPAAAEAWVGRGHGRGGRARGAAAARGSTERPASPRLPAVPGAAAAAPEVAAPVPAQLAASSAASAPPSEAELLAADLLGAAPEAAAACMCSCGCGQPAAAVAAPPPAASADVSSRSGSSCASHKQRADVTWHSAATSAAAAGGAITASPSASSLAQLSAEASSCVRSVGAGSSPRASPVEEEQEEPVEGCDLSSEVSDSSVASWQSASNFLPPSRPSDYGLSYNFRQHSPLAYQWEHRNPSVPAHSFGHHSGPPSPQKLAPLADPGLRHVRRSTGTFGPNSSTPLAGSGGFFAAPPAALHHAQHAASMPLLPLAAYHHHRSASSSSSSSQSGGSLSEGAGPQVVGYPAGVHRWQGSMLSSWAEPYSPHHQQQLYMHTQVLVQPAAYVPRSQSVSGRQQWAPPPPPGSGPAVEPYRHPHRAWQQQHAHPEAALPYKPPPPPPTPAMHGSTSSGSGSGGRVGSPLLAGSSNAHRSAPASTVSSPLLGRGQLPAGQPSKTPPPPQLLSAPVLDLQVPESVEDSPDLERFMQAATPQVVPPPTGAQDLTLADLWRWYEEPSTLGCEVTTIGGPRGPATAYFLPYLSAVQLLAPVSAADEAAVLAAAAAAPAGAATPPPQLLSYPNGLESWPERMRPVVQWGEDSNMRDRVPLHSRLADVCGAAGAEHPLMATRIADLHPFSWFAVAWYPLYCVPEAPLTARFLTFHTLASLWETASTAAAERSEQQQQALAAAAAKALQQQWLAAAEAAAAAALEGGAGQGQHAAAVSHGAAAPPSPGTAAHLTSPPALRSHLAHKSMPMLSDGPPAPAEGQPPQPVYTATPTAVCSFPTSPTCSDAGTRTTQDLGMGSLGSRPPSVDGMGGAERVYSGAGSAASATAGRSRLALSSGAGSLSPGGARGSLFEPLSLSLPASSAATSSGAASTPASPPASEAEGSAEALPVPVAGLTWYATGREENWQETLVAAPLPPGIPATPGTPLAGGARLLGSWRGVAVLARSYPVAKGGPLGWEIQQEEMAQCAERLTAGAGLVALRPRLGAGGQPTGSWDRVGRLPAATLGVSCPDYEFFTSRAARYA